MDEQTLTQFDSYTALNRAALLKPDKDDQLLASILQDSTVTRENSRRALIQYTDEVTGNQYGMILIAVGLDEAAEDTLKRMVAPQIWTRVTMERVSFYAKQVR